MQRPQYVKVDGTPREAEYQMPPGQWGNNKPRGKPKVCELNVLKRAQPLTPVEQDGAV